MSNFCVFYRDNFKYINEVSELNIIYQQQPIKSITEFLNKYRDKRINIFIHDSEYFAKNKMWDYFFALVEQSPELNFALVLSNIEDENVKKIYEALNANQEKKIKYFFEVYINNWDILNGYLSLHPSDVYIVEDLAFQLERVKNLTNKYNCRIRCFPNVAQSACPITANIKSFFIRPEDIELYSNWVDVFEIWGRKESLDTVYKIYVKDKKWFGKLSELIVSFDDDVDNRCIDPMFAMRRSNCEKRCMMGRPCKICDVIKELANTLEKKNLIFRANKD